MRVSDTPSFQFEDSPASVYCLSSCPAQEDGDYIGFDTSEFTSRTGGKLAAVKAIKVPSCMLHLSGEDTAFMDIPSSHAPAVVKRVPK